MKTVTIVGTFDTKGPEFALLMSELQARGLNTLTVDLSTKNEPSFDPDVSAREVASAAGENLDEMKKTLSRKDSMAIMAKGAASICRQLCDEQKVDGIVGMAGGSGTYMIRTIMSEMPLGFPKLLVSTVAAIARDSFLLEGINDTMTMNPIVDVSGLNSFLRDTIKTAAGAIAGAVEAYSHPACNRDETVRIGISMWGVTTPCVTRINELLSERGYEVYVFSASGFGGNAMERFAEQGFFDGVFDITLAEVSNPVIGADFYDVPFRLEKVAAAGIPYIVSVGGVDMVWVGKPANLKEKFRDREQYLHSADVMFVRSSVEENAEVARVVARKLNAAKGPVTVALPLQGISAVDVEGSNMRDEKANQALFSTLKDELNDRIEVVNVDAHINEPEFADKVASIMIAQIENVPT